jgi:hypothetical protein
MQKPTRPEDQFFFQKSYVGFRIKEKEIGANRTIASILLTKAMSPSR